MTKRQKQTRPTGGIWKRSGDDDPISVCLPACLPTCLPACLPVCLPAWLSDIQAYTCPSIMVFVSDDIDDMQAKISEGEEGGRGAKKGKGLEEREKRDEESNSYVPVMYGWRLFPSVGLNGSLAKALNVFRDHRGQPLSVSLSVSLSSFLYLSCSLCS